MPVSQTGSSVGFKLVRQVAAVVVVTFCTLGYLYGPPVSPAMRNAAIAECNNHAEGNYRSFRLGWRVGVHPHWECGDASRPTQKSVSLGWWTNPFR
jgi:hypothetical protein